MEEKAEKFVDRWLDTTKSTLLFSKGIILVEGLAEALLIPKLAELYLKELKEKNKNKMIPLSLEEAGISIINMNGIFFHYFMQIYRGYQLILPKRKIQESKEKFKKRLNEFIKKEKFIDGEYICTAYIPIRCVALTDNDPPKESKPTKIKKSIGSNPHLHLIKQLINMTDNCRVFTNLKTFEYDIALETENAKCMIEIIIESLETDGDIKEKMKSYLQSIEQNDEIENNEMAFDILTQVDGNYMGKGLFAQLLLEKIDKSNEFVVPQYIKDAVKFVLAL